MNGIAGFVRFDGMSADPIELIAMTGRLAHRGEAAVNVEGSVGLAAIHCDQPVVVRASWGWVAADARIDNRRELAKLLGLDPMQTGDAGIVAAAYERWGEDCVEHLIGDFAVAIYDCRLQKLLCARDHMGARPFYYYSSSGLFAFATEIKGLLALSDVPAQIDEARIADYLMPLVEDQETTFYRNVFRLPAAHCMTVSASGVRKRRYWQLDPEREIRYGSDEEYAEAFREIFTEAVRCRLDIGHPTGSMLSGGLDSSSIVCTARQVLGGNSGMLHTFSARFPDVAECDEGEYIRSVVNGGGMQQHDVAVDTLGPLSVASDVLSSLDEPMFGPNTFFNSALYSAARESGVRVMLDGTDGDTVVSHGITYLNELARTGRWIRLGREVRGLSRNLQVPVPTVIWRRGIKPLVPGLLRLKKRLTGYEENLPGMNVSVADAEFARRTHLYERAVELLSAYAETPQTARAYHLRGLQSGLLPLAMEELDHVASCFGIDSRYPFFDKRMVEFCLALPGSQKIHHGWTRSIMRNAMAGMLPEKVRWRRGKANLSMNFRLGLFQRDNVLLRQHLTGGLLRSSGYVNNSLIDSLYQSEWQQAADRVPKTSASDAVRLWRGASLSLWMERNHVETSAALMPVTI